MYKYRDQLKKHLAKKELQFLLEYNEQEIPSGEEKVIYFNILLMKQINLIIDFFYRFLIDFVIL